MGKQSTVKRDSARNLKGREGKKWKTDRGRLEMKCVCIYRYINHMNNI